VDVINSSHKTPVSLTAGLTSTMMHY